MCLQNLISNEISTAGRVVKTTMTKRDNSVVCLDSNLIVLSSLRIVRAICRNEFCCCQNNGSSVHPEFVIAHGKTVNGFSIYFTGNLMDLISPQWSGSFNDRKCDSSVIRA